MMKKLFAALAAVTALGLGPAAAQAIDAGPSATASMINADGNDVGTVTFNQTASGMLHIFAEIIDLPPGPHGFHIHEVGECDPDDGFESAGGHLAGDNEHGIYNEAGPHPGDLPNVHVGQDGILKVEYFSESLTLVEGSAGSLLGGDGTAVMIHEGQDDYATDPHGEAGSRFACGVITQVSPG